MGNSIAVDSWSLVPFTVVVVFDIDDNNYFASSNNTCFANSYFALSLWMDFVDTHPSMLTDTFEVVAGYNKACNHTKMAHYWFLLDQ